MKLDDALKIHAAVRDYIKHEDTLTNYRLTWMLTVHGFLYAAYALTVQKKFEITQKIISDTLSDCSHPGIVVKSGHSCSAYVIQAYQASPHFVKLGMQMDWLINMLACVGFGISAFAFFSILGAKRATAKLQESFESQFCTAETDTYFIVSHDGQTVALPNVCGGGSAKAKYLGGSASFWIPLLLAAGWVTSILLMSKFGVEPFWQILTSP